jgi:hypothetical protein
MFGFLLLGLIFLIWIFYRVGSAFSSLNSEKTELAKEIYSLKQRKAILEGMVQDVKKIHQQQLEDYGVELKEERAKRQVAMETEFYETKKNNIEKMGREVAQIKSNKLEQLERDIIGGKQSSIADLDSWMEQEKYRLQKRLDTQYEQKIDTLKKALEEKVLFEMEQFEQQSLVVHGDESSQLKGEIAAIIKDATHSVLKSIK